MTDEEKTTGEVWLDIGQGWCVRYETTETWLDFKAWEVVGVEVSPNPGRKSFHAKGLGSEQVYTVEEAEPDLTGYVKWDGCSEMTIGQPHFCGAADVAQFCEVMKAVHALALKIPRVDYDCAGYPAPDERTEGG